MENASKALIITAEILIGVLLLTLMFFAFRAIQGFSSAVEYNIETNNVNEFNTRFEKFRNRNDLTIQDVVTIRNLAREYNKQIGQVEITVTVLKVDARYKNAHDFGDNLLYEFIKQYSNDSNNNNQIIRFQCAKDGMQYDKTTGKISQIILKKLD
ncbi:MAG: hypothetical protein HFJ27_06465 [Clostridia bacterium]|nr:hypothetical protein [Clostridia bacterium]